MVHQTLQVLFRREEESWNSFARRIREMDTDVLIVLSASDASLLLKDEQPSSFLSACSEIRKRLRIATKFAPLVHEVRLKGIRTITRTKTLKHALAGHPQAEDALRLFSPNLWRQQWRTHLQTAGLLSVPRLRVFLLILLSTCLFLFVVLRLLPSSEILISPRGDITTQTTNVFLVDSGATNLPSHIRTMPLIPIEVKLQRSLTFDQISKQFIGTDAEVPLTVINKGGDQASLKKGTRFRNQAGMIFRIEKSILVPQNGTMTVRAKADELDEYGEIIGERGNLPAGLQWEIPALSQADRKQLYGENRVPATGGKTAYRTVLQKADLDAAQRLLEQQLLADAKKQVDERVQSMQLTSGKDLRLLSSDQLVKTTFSGFVLPVQLLNQPVAAITAQGGLTYRVCAYDADAILDLVRTELLSHIADDKRPLLDTADLKHLNLRVFDYADDRSWIKATIELTATEQFILDPLTPAGARFDKKVRETVAGLSRQDALRIINNFPEVEKADISLWPPWDTMLPTILSNISIVTRS